VLFLAHTFVQNLIYMGIKAENPVKRVGKVKENIL
jgi:hypothetical protein